MSRYTSTKGKANSSEPQNAFDVVARNPDQFSTLAAVVERAGLADALAKEGLTVFAPTDEAFSMFMDGLDRKTAASLDSPRARSC